MQLNMLKNNKLNCVKQAVMNNLLNSLNKQLQMMNSH